jgi:two-component system LytT family response regulator
MKAVIIDDEPRAVHILEMVVSEYCSGVEICGRASSISDGIKEIRETHPDLIFLDIEMPDGSGFDVLTAFPERSFDVVFVTAYNHYALKAIKYSAADYILKPVDIEEVKAAMEKVRIRRSTPGAQFPDLNELMLNIRAGAVRKIAVPSSDGSEFIAVDDIMYIEADRSYCNIVLTNDNKMLVSKNLSNIEELLPRDMFYRIHKSFLINLNFMKKYYRTDGGYVEMQDGKKMSIARNKKDEFMGFIGKWMGRV